MTVQTLPDPELSRAVLIGVSKYHKLPPLASVNNNLGALAAILRDPGVWGLPQEHCTVIANPTTAGRLVEPIKTGAEEAVDTLLVYYAGHGLTDRAGDLQLTVSRSDTDNAYSQVPYQWVRDPIRDSPARRRIVILDCCYSGRAANDAMGDDAPYAAQADVEGSFILTATPENREALAPANQMYTAFTHELVDVLSEGLTGGDALLSLNEIFNHVKIKLRANSLPPPQARDRNNLGAQTSFRNKAFLPGAARHRVSPERRDAESQVAVRRLRTVCLRASADFLRRERLPAHDGLYVERPIDREIGSVITALSPINLRRMQRVAKPRRGETKTDPVARIAPPQIMVLSDEPGSGKTMLAVQLSRFTETWATVLRNASDPVADDLRHVIEGLGPNHGINLLLQARMPIVFVVDGLDQANHASDQKQIIELFRLISALNKDAQRQRMLAFPITVLLTVQESEWDRWFTVFEGRNIVEFRGAIPRFDPAQLDVALDKYSTAYDYGLDGDLPTSVLTTLAVPVNLRTMSETYEYQGHTDASEAFDEHLLSGYVRRKAGIVVGLLPWLTTMQFTAALTALAMALVEQRTIKIDIARAKLTHILDQRTSREDVESLLRALIDEKILSHAGGRIQFRLPGVVEYLVAVESVREMSESGKVGSLERLTSRVAEASPASSAAFRFNVEEIVRTQHSDAQQMVSEHYATSAAYTGSRLGTLRFNLSAGSHTSQQDLDSIYGSLYSLRPEDAWDAFFVVVAVANHQPADRMIEAFTVAWDVNDQRADRWKLLSKLRERSLLYCGEAIVRVMRSRDPRDWETLLGSLAQEQNRQEVLADIRDASDRPLNDLIGDGPEWRQVQGLLSLLLNDELYVTGKIW